MKIGQLLIPIFAVILIFYFISTINTDANPAVDLEVNNYTANNTYFAFANNPVNSYGFHLYYFGNTTFEIPTANYDFNTTHIKIYTNGTADYPNITENANYYSSYTYQKSATVWGINFSFMAILVIIGVGLILVAKQLKFI